MNTTDDYQSKEKWFSLSKKDRKKIKIVLRIKQNPRCEPPKKLASLFAVEKKEQLIL